MSDPSPQVLYRNAVEQGSITYSEQQFEIVQLFQELFLQLSKKPSVLEHWFRSKPQIKGIYLWGSVGSGKTFLMDMFYNSLPFSEKYRVHFHRLMYQVQLLLKQYRNQRDPLKLVAQAYSKKYRVFCIDEFIVVDIADAMLLGRFFTELINKGVVFVSTSNTVPDRLYWGGLQRERFLPAIATIIEHNHVIALKSQQDYRLIQLRRRPVYLSPLGSQADNVLLEHFSKLSAYHTQQAEDEENTITIHGRVFHIYRQMNNLVWFDYKALLDTPCSSMHYLEIAKLYPIVILSGVPILDDTAPDRVQRFIWLIDTLYDCQVKLIISAQNEPKTLYTGCKLAEPFKRISSRLEEMQGIRYLEKPHMLGETTYDVGQLFSEDTQ